MRNICVTVVGQKVKGDMVIRLFHETDLEPLHEMICHTLCISYSGIYPARAVQFFKEHHSKKRIAERSAMGLVLIIERDGAILATGTLMENEIIAVFVYPNHQRQGYGRAIMTELEGRARTRGFSEVVLSISLPSRKFYEDLGYEVLAECALDVGEGQYLNYWPGRKSLGS